MAIKLRDYQQEVVQISLDEFKHGISRQLIALPTGVGKTIIMAAIAKYLNTKTLVLSHREELIKQTKDKFKMYWKNADIGICKAELNELDHQIVIGSVQSCMRKKRLEQLCEQGFKLLLIDEAHHAAAKSYSKIVSVLGFLNDEAKPETKSQETKPQEVKPQKLLIGLTATPERSDNLGLGNIFEKIVFLRSIQTMIKAGYLSPVYGRRILTDVSLKDVRTQNGDFVVGDLAYVINTTERNNFITDKFIEHANERKGLFFCANVQHCKDLADTLNERGITAKAVWGLMPPEDRAQTLKDFKQNKIQAITSCAVLTEGYDEPSIECVVMARPTKSRGRYLQCLGRGIRLFPSKKDCLVLDFADKYHDLNCIMSLKKTIPGVQEVRDRDDNRQAAGGLMQSLMPEADVRELNDESFDILGQTRFVWISIGDDEYSLSDDFNNEIVINPTHGGYTAKLYIKNSCIDVVIEPLPLDYCSAVCEDYARANLHISYTDLTNSWLTKSNNIPATEKQCQFLAKNNVAVPGISKTEAVFKIRKIIAFKRKETRQWKSNNYQPQSYNQSLSNKSL